MQAESFTPNAELYWAFQKYVHVRKYLPHTQGMMGSIQNDGIWGSIK